MEKEDRSDTDELSSERSIDWQLVEKDYLSSEYSVAELAGKYGCYPETIEKYVRRGYWPSCRSMYKADGASGGRDLSVDKPEGVMKEYRMLWDGVKKMLIGGLQSSDIEELKAAKVAAEVLNTVIKGEKGAWGLQEDELRKVPDEETIRIEELTRTMESITIPSGADETMG
ncbi:MAG: hypothetical protein V3V95_00595 [Thermodesulfobacteriota bacterium]